MNTTLSRNPQFNAMVNRFKLNRGLVFGLIIIGALLAFETFNYSTTEFALADLLGDLSFMGIAWSTILAIAFCGIDFAGIARLFTPEDGSSDITEVWYLFGAWLLAATMNAMLTWWGVSIAILNHQSLGNAVITRDVMLRAVPIFVAVMVWLIRVLIIGTFSVAGNRLFTQSDRRIYKTPRQNSNVRTVTDSQASLTPRASSASMSAFKPAPKPSQNSEPLYNRPEPTYHPVSISAKANRGQNSQNRR
jgi:hypothetical protein